MTRKILRRTTECSGDIQLIEKFEVGSPGRIRTYSLSVNSRNDPKSKCPIWCRLREIGSHFSFFGGTHTCTHGNDFLMVVIREQSGSLRRVRKGDAGQLCYRLWAGLGL